MKIKTKLISFEIGNTSKQGESEGFLKSLLRKVGLGVTPSNDMNRAILNDSNQELVVLFSRLEAGETVSVEEWRRAGLPVSARLLTKMLEEGKPIEPDNYVSNRKNSLNIYDLDPHLLINQFKDGLSDDQFKAEATGRLATLAKEKDDAYSRQVDYSIKTIQETGPQREVTTKIKEELALLDRILKIITSFGVIGNNSLFQELRALKPEVISALNEWERRTGQDVVKKYLAPLTKKKYATVVNGSTWSKPLKLGEDVLIINLMPLLVNCQSGLKKSWGSFVKKIPKHHYEGKARTREKYLRGVETLMGELRLDAEIACLLASSFPYGIGETAKDVIREIQAKYGEAELENMSGALKSIWKTYVTYAYYVWQEYRPEETAKNIEMYEDMMKAYKATLPFINSAAEMAEFSQTMREDPINTIKNHLI